MIKTTTPKKGSSLSRMGRRVHLALIFAFLLVACAKDGDVQPEEVTLEPAVAAAREAFAQHLQTLPKPRGADFTRLARQQGDRTIHWELAHSVKTGLFDGMRIPVSYSNQQTAIIDSMGNKYPLQQNTWLLVQENDGDGYRFSMLTVLPMGEHLAKPGSRYSGVLEVTDWNGRLLTAYIYADGVPVAVSSTDKAKSQAIPPLVMAVDNTGEYICVPIMAETCVGNPADPNDQYVCNTRQVGQQCYFTGGGNGFPPIDDMPVPDEWYGGGSPNPPSDTAVKNQIKNKPFALLDIPCDIIKSWVATAKFTVSQSTWNKLYAIDQAIKPGTQFRYTNIQNLNSAYSTVVNMDYFPVTVNQLPIVNGKRLTAPEFMQHIRKNINSFVDTDYSEFEPFKYSEVDDTQLWNSNNPLNAVVAIDIKGPDNGSVIVSKFNSTGWTFTTIHEPRYLDHPVSGNRDFGYIQNSNGSYTFYTRGVDRLTSFEATALQWLSDKSDQNVPGPFSQADALWKSFQNKIDGFVKSHGGNSSVNNPQINRPNWNQIKAVLDGQAPLSTLSKDCPD